MALTSDQLNQLAQEHANNIINRPAPANADIQGGSNKGITNYVNQNQDNLTVPGFDQPQKGPLQTALENKFTANPISEASQTAQFGGPVGSKEWLQYKADHPYTSFLPMQVGTSFGVQYPSQENWDKMSAGNKFKYDVAEGFLTAGRWAKGFVTGLPKAIWGGVASTGVMIADPVIGAVTGTLGQEKTYNIPGAGEIPNANKLLADNFKAAGGGFNGFVSTLLGSTGNIVLNATIAGSLLDGAVKTIPKAIKGIAGKTEPVTQGNFIRDISQIDETIAKANAAKVQTAENTASVYHPVTRTTAKNFNSAPGSTYYKFTPVNENHIKVSVVENRKGAIPGLVDKFTKKPVTAGKFGPEVVKSSHIVETKVPVVGDTGIKLPEKIQPVPKTPKLGWENTPIREQDIGNLYKMAQVNGLDPAVRDMVINHSTGKSAIGDLTQTDYVTAARAIDSLKGSMAYAGPEFKVSGFKKWFQPAGRLMDGIEQRTQIPIFSNVYNRLENTFNTRKLWLESNRTKMRDIFGKYAEPKYAKERPLVDAWLNGDKGILENNKAITPQVKSDLIDIANKMKVEYDRVWQIHKQINPDLKKLPNYTHHVQDIGGTFALNKSDFKGTIPGNIASGPEFKRFGSSSAYIDDPLASWDIYLGRVSNSIHLNPTLSEMKPFIESLPADIKDVASTYVNEKLGMIGGMEKGVNEIAARINQWLGRDYFSRDAGRVLQQTTMDHMYSGALGVSPGKAARNLTQGGLNYAEFGPEDFGKAVYNSFTDKALGERLRTRGLDVPLGQPSGYELAKEITPTGKILKADRAVTQGSLELYGKSDFVNRKQVLDMVENRVMRNTDLYNKGKISWNQLEANLDFNSFSDAGKTILRNLFREGKINDPESIANGGNDVVQFMSRQKLDGTQFPYRSAASARIFYGMEGKTLGTFMQWPVNYTNTLLTYAKNGEYEKLMRLAAFTSVLNNSLKNSGVDFSKYLGFGPIKPGVGPIVDFMGNAFAVLKDELQNPKNAYTLQDLEANKDAMVRFGKSLGIPTGSFWQNFLDGIDSIQRGPNPIDGKYNLTDKKGRVSYSLPFNEILLHMMGFPSESKNAQLQTEAQGSSLNFEQQKLNAEVTDLFAKGDDASLQKAYRIMQENPGVHPSGLGAVNSPFNKLQRDFQTWSPAIKEKMYPLVFPNNNQ